MRAYLCKYKSHALWAMLFVFVVHGAKLNSNIVGIDTEDLIHLGTEFYDGWLNTGRQGLVFTKYLTQTVVYNPYFAGLMTLLGLAGAVLAFMMLWDRVTGEKTPGFTFAWTGCMFLWIAHPILAEQFYFTLQGAEICIGMLLTAASVGMIYEAGRQKRRSNLLLYGVSGVILLLTFSTYQIFVVFFIFGTVTVLLLQSLNREAQDKKSAGKQIKEILQTIFPYVGVFLGAFICNSIVTHLFFSESDYLSSQIRWGTMSFRDCIYRIAVHGRDVFTGQNSIFYSWVFGALCVIGLVTIVLSVKRLGLIPLFYYAALMTTPFLMTVVCADVPAVRSQLILPAITGFVLYLDVLLIQRYKTEAAKQRKWSPLVVVLVLLGLIGVTQELQTSLRLYYTDACRYAEDEALGRALIVKLEDLIGQDETPVVVIGSREFQGNNACVEGEIIGRSLFAHDVEEEPRYYWSTRRVVGFLHTLGYDCEQLPDKNIPYAVEFAENMDVWPGEYSVVHAGDMIVIKLSETENE